MVNQLFSPDSFVDGIRRACREAGRPDASELVVKLAEFGAEASCLGDGFVKGASGFLDRIRSLGGEPEYETVRKKSLLRKLLPWAVALGGGALALQYGNLWGRHAEATGSDMGPVRGTLDAILNSASGGRFRLAGGSGGAPKDEYHSPITNDQYKNLVTYGSKYGPDVFDELVARDRLPSEV